MLDQDCFSHQEVKACVLSQNTPFIDIGVPEAFSLAQEYIPDILTKY